MKIEDLLVKPLWRRRLPPKQQNKKQTGGITTLPMQFDSGSFRLMSQSDFLDELNPSSHLINCVNYRAMRTKYKYNPTTKTNEPNGLEDVERIAVAVQQGIRRHKRTHTFGNDMWFGSESKDDEGDKLVSLYRSHWNMTGMTDALSSWGDALFGTGDAGLYLYREGDRINYKVFSFENGDVIAYKKDAKGNDIFIRMFAYEGKKAVEIYGPVNVEFWLSGGKPEENGTPDPMDDKKVLEVSEDGYVLKARVAHGRQSCPVVYARLNDVVWGIGQPTIEHIESLLSDLGENNKYFAYQILFLSGGVMNLPPAKGMGKTIASKSPDGKAEILKPANASDTFKLDYEKSCDMLWECTGTTVVDPKEMKAGENTGAFITNLYWREIQWSKNMIADLRPAFNTCVSIFSEYVGLIESKSTEMKNLRMSFLLEPFVPKNITEEINNVCNAKNSKITSIKTASGEIPFNSPREEERLEKELKEERAQEDKRLAARTAVTVANSRKVKGQESGTDNKANS